MTKIIVTNTHRKLSWRKKRTDLIPSLPTSVRWTRSPLNVCCFSSLKRSDDLANIHNAWRIITTVRHTKSRIICFQKAHEVAALKTCEMWFAEEVRLFQRTISYLVEEVSILNSITARKSSLAFLRLCKQQAPVFHHVIRKRY